MKRFNFDEIYNALCLASVQTGNDWPTNCARILRLKAVDSCGTPSVLCLNDPEPLKSFVASVNRYVVASIEAERSDENTFSQYFAQSDALSSACWRLAECDPNGMPDFIADADRRVVERALDRLVESVDVDEIETEETA